MEKHFQHFFAQNNQFNMNFWIVRRMLVMFMVLGGHPANIGGGYWLFFSSEPSAVMPSQPS